MLHFYTRREVIRGKERETVYYYYLFYKGVLKTSKGEGKRGKILRAILSCPYTLSRSE